MLRPGKDRGRCDDGSPPKCTRPLASEPRLRPGHDEIRAHRSQITASGRSTAFFAQSLRRADRLFRHHSPGRPILQATVGSRRSQRVPGRIMIIHAIRVILLVSAIVTLFTCIRAPRLSSQHPRRSRDRSRCATQERAPWFSSLRTWRFPRLLMPRSLVFPPVEWFLRYQTEPCGEITCPPELLAIADDGKERRREQRANTGNGGQSPSPSPSAGKPVNLAVTLAIRWSRWRTSSKSSASIRRMAGVRSLASSATTRGRSSRKTPVAWRIAMPYSRQNARAWLMTRVRLVTS